MEIGKAEIQAYCAEEGNDKVRTDRRLEKSTKGKWETPKMREQGIVQPYSRKKRGCAKGSVVRKRYGTLEKKKTHRVEGERRN